MNPFVSKLLIAVLSLSVLPLHLANATEDESCIPLVLAESFHPLLNDHFRLSPNQAEIRSKGINSNDLSEDIDKARRGFKGLQIELTNAFEDALDNHVMFHRLEGEIVSKPSGKAGFAIKFVMPNLSLDSRASYIGPYELELDFAGQEVVADIVASEMVLAEIEKLGGAGTKVEVTRVASSLGDLHECVEGEVRVIKEKGRFPYIHVLSWVKKIE